MFFDKSAADNCENDKFNSKLSGCGAVGDVSERTLRVSQARTKEWQQLGDWQVCSAHADRALVATGSAADNCENDNLTVNYRGVAQLVARDVWDVDAAGSNPVTPTKIADLTASHGQIGTNKTCHRRLCTVVP